MFGWGKRQRDPKGQTLIRIPTVKFDAARVTETVKADLRQNIKSLNEVSPGDFDMIYDAALRSISAGGALHILYQTLMTIDGMGKRRAADISRSLNIKATALMQIEGQKRLGIEYAIWMYSGAPCGSAEQDAAHKAANGKPYLVDQGMLLNGFRTWPGREDDCKCVSRPVLPGFEG